MFTEVRSIKDEEVKKIIQKLPFYNNECGKKIRVKDSSFGLSGRNAVQGYFENKYPVNYVVVQNVTSKSIYIKLYRPRKDSYRGYLCDYYFEFYHLNGGCKGKFLYVYTIVRKDKSCNRTYEKSVWAIGDTNFEIVVNRINLVNGKIDSAVLDDYVLEFNKGSDLIEKYSLYENECGESLSKLFRTVEQLVMRNGFKKPFIRIDTSHFFPSIEVNFKVGNVDSTISIMITHSILKRIYREEHAKTILMRFQKGLAIVLMMKKLFNITSNDTGLIDLMIDYDSDTVKDFVYVIENDNYAVFKYPSLRLPVIEGGAHHLYVKKPAPSDKVLTLLSSLIKISGVSSDRAKEYYDYFYKLLSKCQISGESVFYVKQNSMGHVLTTTCGSLKKHFIY